MIKMKGKFKDRTSTDLLEAIKGVMYLAPLMAMIAAFNIGSNIVEAQINHNCTTNEEIFFFLFENNTGSMANSTGLLLFSLAMVCFTNVKIIPELMVRCKESHNNQSQSDA